MRLVRSGTTSDDFTNKSVFVPPNLIANSNQTLDPDSLGFTNTVKNNGTSASDITVVPTAPATKTDLPNGTKVTVSYDTQRAVYTYDSTNGVFTIPSGNTPVKVPSVAPNGTFTYGVEVDLPSGTPLSTDTSVLRGFPVPMTATLVDSTGSPRIDNNSQPIQNITIDRVYTGFLQLLKKSQILQGTDEVYRVVMMY